MASYKNKQTGEVLTETQFKQRYGGTPAATKPAIPAPVEARPSLFADIGSDFNKRTNTASDAQLSKQNPISKVLQTVGQGAGFIGDIAGDVIDHTPLLGEGVRSVTEQIAAAPHVQQIASDYETWKSKHPEAAGNLESIVNIGGLFGGGAASKAAKDVAATAATNAVAKNAEKQVVKQAANTAREALELTAPVLNKKASISAFERAGKPGGVETTGKTGKIQYTPTSYDKQVAEAAAPYISKAKNPAQNSHALGTEIERFAEQEVTPFLKNNPRAVNVKTIEADLRSKPIPDLFKTDAVLEKSYELVRNRMIARVKESGGTTFDIWNARKRFDEDVLKEFGDVAFDDVKYTPLNRAIKDMRTGVNDFISQQIGDSTFSEQMSRLNRLYEAKSRIAEKNYKLLGSDKFKRVIEAHPKAWNLIKWGAGGTGAIGAFNALTR